LIAVLIPMVMGRFLIDIYPISPITSIREERHKSVIFLEWCTTRCPIKRVCSTPSFSWVIDRVHRFHI
jgi:hypothetical protein